MATTPFKDGAQVCRTHRGYTKSYANDNAQILIPDGAHYMTIRNNAQELVYSIDATKKFSVETLEHRVKVNADSEGMGLTECPPGWYINISHSDGTTAIGELEVVFAGGEDLPDALVTTVSDS